MILYWIICGLIAALIVNVFIGWLVSGRGNVVRSKFNHPKIKNIRFKDGDTFEIMFDRGSEYDILGGKVAFRIDGMDAAEMSGKCPITGEREHPHKKIYRMSARAAKRKAEEIAAEGKRIELIDNGADHRGRRVGDMIIDGKKLSESMVEADVAVKWNYPKQTLKEAWTDEQ